MNELYAEIGDKTYRDGFHCSLGVGRYMLGCVCFMTFFEKEPISNACIDFDVDVSDFEMSLAEKIAKETVKKRKQ